MTDMEIEIALEPDTLELTFDLSGGSAPQPMPEPAPAFISGASHPLTTGTVGAYPFIAGEAVRSYDETKINVILLDDDDNRTDSIQYFDTVTALRDFFAPYVDVATAVPKYEVIFGDRCGVTDNDMNFPFTPPPDLPRHTYQNRAVRKVTVNNGITRFYNTDDHMTLGYISVVFSIHLPQSIQIIDDYSFLYSGWYSSLTEIIINKPEGSISGAPWGADNATVIWTG